MTTVPGGSSGTNTFFEVGGEGGAIHRALYHSGRDHRVGTQSSDEGLRAPGSKRCIHHQPIPTPGPPALSRQIGFDGGFIRSLTGDCTTICREGMNTSRCGAARIAGMRRCSLSTRRRFT